MSSRNNVGRANSTTSMPTSIKPKKKPAPPRPPQPRINRLQTSQSFNTAQDFNPGHGDFVKKGPTGKDLIDFSTPPSSPGSSRRNTVATIGNSVRDPNEFSYRVGASIFYIKSQLKSSAPEAPKPSPFSPPRPAQIPVNKSVSSVATGQINTANINSAWSSKSSSNQITAWDTPPAKNNPVVAGGFGVINSQYQNTSSLDNNNTIKSHYQNQSAWIPAGISSSSNASSNRSTPSFSDANGGATQHRYGNVPDTGRKELTGTLSGGSGTGFKPRAPTIIRPSNKAVTQSSKDVQSTSRPQSAVFNSFNNYKPESEATNTELDSPMQRNYYDIPPDEDYDDNDDDPNDSSFVSPPMPSEPPPPPPADVLAVDEWVNSTTGVADYPDTYSDAEQVTAYAIALFDFTPEAEGDLTLQTGDLVYLLRRIDDSWYFGSCGGMEGMFPSDFVNVIVPIQEEPTFNSGTANTEEDFYANVLYDFPAEAETDISLQVNDKVKILGRINDDWLYGEINGTKGQFPAAFVEEFTRDLPIITI